MHEGHKWTGLNPESLHPWAPPLTTNSTRDLRGLRKVLAIVRGAEHGISDPRPLSGYPAVAGRSDEVGRTTAALPPWRLVT